MELSWDGYHLSLREGKDLGIRVKRLPKTVSTDAPHPCWGLSDIRAAPLLSACSASTVLLTVLPGALVSTSLHILLVVPSVSNGPQV